MPTCKNCHSRIDKFNKDRCPICGVVNPFEGVTSETVEITTSIDTEHLDIEYHPRKKKTLLWLFVGLGIFGVPFFYIYKRKVGIIYALINIILLATSITLLSLFSGVHFAIIIVSMYILFTMINTGVGLYYYNAPNIKDGHGEFLI